MDFKSRQKTGRSDIGCPRCSHSEESTRTSPEQDCLRVQKGSPTDKETVKYVVVNYASANTRNTVPGCGNTITNKTIVTICCLTFVISLIVGLLAALLYVQFLDKSPSVNSDSLFCIPCKRLAYRGTKDSGGLKREVEDGETGMVEVCCGKDSEALETVLDEV